MKHIHIKLIWVVGSYTCNHEYHMWLLTWFTTRTTPFSRSRTITTCLIMAYSFTTMKSTWKNFIAWLIALPILFIARSSWHFFTATARSFRNYFTFWTLTYWQSDNITGYFTTIDTMILVPITIKLKLEFISYFFDSFMLSKWNQAFSHLTVYRTWMTGISTSMLFAC